MQLVDLALGERDQLHAGEGEVLAERGDILLVAREAVEGLGHDHVELAGSGILEDILASRSCAGCQRQPSRRQVRVGSVMAAMRAVEAAAVPSMTVMMPVGPVTMPPVMMVGPSAAPPSREKIDRSKRRRYIVVPRSVSVFRGIGICGRRGDCAGTH
jgi:hypothetical protein